MAGILEDVFNVRTNGNGFVRSWWDNILLLRDLEQLISEGRVKLIRDQLRTSKYLLPAHAGEAQRKWVQDTETGDIYEYFGPYERTWPSFRKLDFGGYGVQWD
jgi:hypothetical protein